MPQSPSSEHVGPAARRVATLALVGLLVVSAIGGVVGSNGIVAAQQGGSAGNATAGNTTAGNTTTTGNATASGGGANNSTAANSVAATIQDFKQANVGYRGLSSKQKKSVKKQVRDIANYSGKLRGSKKLKMYQDVYNAFGYKRVLPFSEASRDRNKIANILDNNFKTQEFAGVPPKQVPPKDGPLSKIDLGIPSLIEKKLDAIADAMKAGAAAILTNVYNSAFSTPVPENSGWHGIFGQPTNEPFQKLHQNLLVEKLYPVTNLLLGIGVIVLGLSLTVNPLISRFRALDLIIKFTAFLLLYVFAWGAVTLMHGIVNDITMWIRPSPKAMGQLVTNVGKMSAGAVGAYFIGSGGILATAFGLALELEMRNVLLKWFLPYIFMPLVFILYVSPWQRLQSVVSVVLWQYANVLTMVIPMALFLRAATLVTFNPDAQSLSGMIAVITLYAAAALMPVFTTWFFAKVPGKAVGGVKSAAAGAASRASAAKDKLGWGDEDSSDSTATGNTSPGDRTEEAVEATLPSESGLSSSGELSAESVEQMDPAGNSETTAAKVRAFDEEQHRDPNNAAAKYEAYFDENQVNKSAYNTPTAD